MLGRNTHPISRNLPISCMSCRTRTAYSVEEMSSLVASGSKDIECSRVGEGLCWRRVVPVLVQGNLARRYTPGVLRGRELGHCLACVAVRCCRRLNEGFIPEAIIRWSTTSLRERCILFSHSFRLTSHSVPPRAVQLKEYVTYIESQQLFPSEAGCVDRTNICLRIDMNANVQDSGSRVSSSRKTR